MGCCGSQEDDDSDREESNPGPDIRRGCTDVWCGVVLVAFLSMQGIFMYFLHDVSDVRKLDHGKDHYGNLCGLEGMKHRRHVYYPDLHTDLSTPDGMKHRYGICVPQCPKEGELVDEKELYPRKDEVKDMRKHGKWFVPLPSLPIAGRCVPYKSPERTVDETFLCAYPQCAEKDESVDQALTVCGLRRDGTNKSWLLSKPDYTLVQGWKSEGASESDIEAWTAIASQTDARRQQGRAPTCEVITVRGVKVKTQLEDQSVLYNALTQYTGVLYTWGKAIYHNFAVVAGFGVGGAVITSFLIICLFAICVRCVLVVLMISLFVVLAAADYVLFVQAGVATGNTGRWFLGMVQDMTEVDTSEVVSDYIASATALPEGMQRVYYILAVSLAVIMFLLLCFIFVLRKNFELLVALLKEASRMIREMPSMLFVPFALVASMGITSLVLMYGAVEVVTMNRQQVLDIIRQQQIIDNPDDELFDQARKTGLGTLLFGFLWAYFYHVGLLVIMVSMMVSQWYFYRDDPERNHGLGRHSPGYFPGRPALIALGKVFRHHLGSLALGSFFCALVAFIRLVFEYLERQHNSQNSNEVVKVLVWATRCCLWCMQKCTECITEYSYVYIAITGRPFLAAARASMVLVAKYPAQAALDKIASHALGCIVCITVPSGMAVLSLFFLRHKSDWLPCAFGVTMMAYATTRLVVGVYDVCVTTLFICSIRDMEKYDGRYMPESLDAVLGVRGAKRSSEVELPESGVY